MQRSDQHTTSQTEAQRGRLPWLLALGAGLAGASFSCDFRENEGHVVAAPLAEAIQFPKNIKPGIVLVQVNEDAFKDPQRIVDEFQREHPDLTVLASEEFTEVVPRWGRKHYLKIVYEVGSKSGGDSGARGSVSDPGR